jgi:hypothetical protein
MRAGGNEGAAIVRAMSPPSTMFEEAATYSSTSADGSLLLKGALQRAMLADTYVYALLRLGSHADVQFLWKVV